MREPAEAFRRNGRGLLRRARNDTMAPSTPLILDVDTGIDDAFALLYALAQPSIRLLGVSSVAGNVDLAKATRNTRAVLALAGRADIPVWPGCAAPLLHAPEDASDIHGATGLGYAVLPEPPGGPLPYSRDRRDPRGGAGARGRVGPGRDRAAHQYRRRVGARSRAAAPAEALRLDGRGVSRVGQRHAGGRVQHLARSGSGAHRVSRVRDEGRARRWSPSVSTSPARRCWSRPISPRSRSAAPGCRAPPRCCASSRIPRAIISS